MLKVQTIEDVEVFFNLANFAAEACFREKAIDLMIDRSSKFLKVRPRNPRTGSYLTEFKLKIKDIKSVECIRRIHNESTIFGYFAIKNDHMNSFMRMNETKKEKTSCQSKRRKLSKRRRSPK